MRGKSLLSALAGLAAALHRADARGRLPEPAFDVDKVWIDELRPTRPRASFKKLRVAARVAARRHRPAGSKLAREMREHRLGIAS